MDPAILTRVHFCLLSLLAKTVGSEGGRSRLSEDAANVHAGEEKACQLLGSARRWAWRLLRPAEVTQVLDWYVMSADPRVVLAEGEVKKIDAGVLELLTTACCFDNESNELSSSVRMLKRQSFLRACMKLIMSCVSRHKTIVSTRPQLIKQSITHYLDSIERLITPPVLKEEPDVLLSEVLTVVANASLSCVVLDCVEAWFRSRPASCPLLLSALHVVGVSVGGAEPCGRLLEAALAALWVERCADDVPPTWKQLSAELRPLPGLEASLAASGRLLTLHAVIVKRSDNCDDCQQLLDALIDWLGEIKFG